MLRGVILFLVKILRFFFFGFSRVVFRRFGFVLAEFIGAYVEFDFINLFLRSCGFVIF